MELVLMIKNMEKNNINENNSPELLIVLILGIALGLFLISCDGQKPQTIEEPIGLRQKSDVRYKNVTEFTYGGCEYIKVGYGDCAWGSHKGNCTNPIHNN
jgi:hypothetical protein